MRVRNYGNNHCLLDKASDHLAEPPLIFSMVLGVESSDAGIRLPGIDNNIRHTFRSIQFFLELWKKDFEKNGIFSPDTRLSTPDAI